MARTYQSVRDGRGELKRVAQFSGDLLGSDVAASVSLARAQVCRWLEKRIPDDLPPAAFDGEPFEIDYPGHHAAAVRLVEDDLDYWCVKFDHPDRNHAGRSWMVEAGVAGSAQHALFGLRLSCFTLGDVPPPQRSTPVVLRHVIESCGLGEAGIPFWPKGWVVGEDLEFERFLGLLQSPDRFAPIYAVSTPDSSDRADDVLIDVGELSRACLGLAHVVVVPGGAADRLAGAVGRDFSVFNGAIRAYQPGFNPLAESPSRHPLSMAGTAQGDAPWGEGSFLDFLLERAYEASARAEAAHRRVPSFSYVKRMLSERRRTATPQAGADPELVELLELEVESLKNEKLEIEADAREFDLLASGYKEEAEAAKRENHWLKTENARLRDLARASGVDSDSDLPVSLERVPAWVEQRLAGLLALHSRAVRAVEQSPYEDVELVCRALLVLGREYRDMKLATGGSLQEAFLKSVEALGMQYGPSMGKSRAAEQGDTYFVEWRGKRRFLENHLKKGVAKDDRHTLRIYFFWDEGNQLVVVGSLPGHLQTRAT